MLAEFNWAIRGIRGPHLLHIYICSLFKRVLMPKQCLHDLLSPSKPRDSHLIITLPVCHMKIFCYQESVQHCVLIYCFFCLQLLNSYYCISLAWITFVRS